jgi:hypothetical protein
VHGGGTPRAGRPRSVDAEATATGASRTA